MVFHPNIKRGIVHCIDAFAHIVCCPVCCDDFDSFDNKYIELQSGKILERISSFGGKLYLEFGGKLFDDFHAARVLPGFCPDSKIKMLWETKAFVFLIVK